MFVYIIRRILLAVPTFLGITLVTFLIINAAPGGPIEQKIQQIRMGGGDGGGSDTNISQELLDDLAKQYGFDKPVHVRYWIWLKNISKLDFGNSFTHQEPVMDLISSKFPVPARRHLAIVSFTRSRTRAITSRW